jgi:uncharacterized RDD family membrane protein YckC
VTQPPGESPERQDQPGHGQYPGPGQYQYPGPGQHPGQHPGTAPGPGPGQYPGPVSQPVHPPGQPYPAQPYPAQPYPAPPYPPYPPYPPHGANQPYGVGPYPPGSLPAGSDPALAEWWQRLLARLIDGFAVALLSLPAVIPAFAAMFHRLQAVARQYPEGPAQPGAQVAFNRVIFAMYGTFFLVAIASAVISFGYDWLQHGLWGRTLGKRALGTKVVTANDRARISGRAAAGRAAIYGVLPAIPFAGGLFALLNELWLLWDPRRQCLHDKAAGTVVVKVSPPGSSASPSAAWPGPGAAQPPGW